MRSPVTTGVSILFSLSKAAHIYKIGADGLVHEIEAVGFVAPYNSPTGWE